MSSAFSGYFRPFSAGKNRKLAGSHWKNPEASGPKYCFHVPLISGVFQPKPVRMFRLGCCDSFCETQNVMSAKVYSEQIADDIKTYL